MEKVEMKKIEFKQTWVKIPGTDYEMVDRLPYEEKEKLATIAADTLFIEDDENGVCYVDHHDRELMKYMLIYGYTNIEVGDATVGEVLDMIPQDGMNALYDYAGDDFSDVVNTMKRLVENAEKVFNAKHGVGGILNTLINTFSKGENGVASVSENREFLEKMLDIADSMKIEKKGPLDIRVGGAKLDFAKKNKN